MSADHTTQHVDVFGGLLRREWQITGRWIIRSATVWMLGMIVLELCAHPRLLLTFGMVYAVMIGAIAGGSESFAGCEEFTFALPATRHQRYLARLPLAGGVLLALQLLGVAAIGFDLPQRLWGLVVESGFTEPFPAVEHRLHYWLAVALPLATFAITFAIAANASRAGLARFAGLLIPIIVALDFLVEADLGRMVTTLSVLALLVLAPLALLIGHRCYVRKEGVSRPEDSAGRNVGRPRQALIALAVLLALLALLVLGRAASSSPRHEPAIEQSAPTSGDQP